MKRLLASAFVAASIGITPAHASSDMAGMGPGFMTCLQFNTIRNGNMGTAGQVLSQGFFFWAQGFMSATNVGHMASGDPVKNLNSVPIERQQQIIRNYCLRNPADQYWQAVGDLYGQMDDSSGD